MCIKKFGSTILDLSFFWLSLNQGGMALLLMMIYLIVVLF